MTTPLWVPRPETIGRTAYGQFAQRWNLEPADLPSAALAEPTEFYRRVWDFAGIVGERGPGPCYLAPTGPDIRSASFYPTATLNYAENLLAGAKRPGARDTALVFVREDGHRQEMSWIQLTAKVELLAGALTEWGVGPGDRVAAWMPNTPATVIAMLATLWVGATFTSTSPDFGVSGVLDRFSQVEPKVLIAADGYVYGNKTHDRLPLLAAVVAGLPSLTQVLVAPEIDDSATVSQRLADLGIDAHLLSEVSGSPVPPLRQPFTAPGFILYSSGTTGVPKCIVHSAAGVLVKHHIEHQLHCDIRAGDRVFYFTTCGWMMWNWLVSALAAGATVVLYDGSPFHPRSEVLWDLAQAEQVTFFGTSAKYLDAANKVGLRPAESHDLGSLRTIASTGSPLVAEGFAYVYEAVKSDVHLASISGGTDLVGCFVLGNPTLPVYPGEIQGPALGMATDVWDDSGQPAAIGERGELVCPTPFPTMPLEFFGDDGTKYNAAYFERFPGVWTHGDFASRTEHGGFIIHGRSDATLNAGGVRIGTAEIYRQVEAFEQVLEALAIGQEWDNDTRIVLFVRLTEGTELTDELRSAIRARVRQECSPRHVPARIVAVADLPRTRSGKLAELAVADVVHGRQVRNVGALANPDALELFANVPELAD